VALAACLALVAGPSVVLSLESDHKTSTAESRTIVLDDGSRVRLAPRSALQVAYSAEERRTRLLSGEAFFEVSRDERRPFRVVAGDVVTTVLGTAFDVRFDGDGTDIAVQSGRVHVAANSLSPPVSQQLEAGETLQVKTDGQVARAAVAPEDVAAWQAGMFVARARPISEIVEALRRYHDGVILVRDDAFLSRRVSGAYDLRTPATTLRGLASAHDAVVREITPWLLIVTAR
jgi:transmembrane sensor